MENTKNGVLPFESALPVIFARELRVVVHVEFPRMGAQPDLVP